MEYQYRHRVYNGVILPEFWRRQCPANGRNFLTNKQGKHSHVIIHHVRISPKHVQSRRQIEAQQAQSMGIIDSLARKINAGSYINIAAHISYYKFLQPAM
jgi:hypothetical protein